MNGLTIKFSQTEDIDPISSFDQDKNMLIKLDLGYQDTNIESLTLLENANFDLKYSFIDKKKILIQFANQIKTKMCWSD